MKKELPTGLYFYLSVPFLIGSIIMLFCGILCLAQTPNLQCSQTIGLILFIFAILIFFFFAIIFGIGFLKYKEINTS